MAIPRILHVTSRRVPLAGVERAFLRRNRHILGDHWEYRIWSDEDNDKAIERYFPDFLGVFRTLPHGVMRADLARLAYMHIEGGWYADTDYEWLRDPTDAAAEYDLVLPMSRDPQGAGDERLGNAVFGSAAGHPFWTLVLRDALTAPISSDLPETAIESTTGPGLLTRHIDLARSYRKAWLPSRPFFHTPVRLVDECHDAFGVHHTRGSWRPNSIRWRVKMTMRRVERTIVTLRQR